MIRVGGVSVYTDEEMDIVSRRNVDVEFNLCAGWWINPNVSARDLLEAADLPGTYDYAVPQGWLDKEIEGGYEWEGLNRGVWYYPPQSLFGEFRSYRSVLLAVKRKVLQAIMTKMDGQDI